jgi:hypothetical protein
MPVRCRPGIHRDEKTIALRFEQVGIGERARRDHAEHLALDGPLLVAGSPICSQIATESPSFMSFAR